MIFILSLLPVCMAVGQLIVGGLNDVRVSPRDQRVVFAVNAIKEQFLPELVELVEIVRARSQVVNGELLHLTLHMRGKQEYHCNVTVLHRVWLQDPERLRIHTDPSCKPRQDAANAEGGPLGQGQQRFAALLGGISDAKPLPKRGQVGHAGVHDALYFAACAANDMVNSPYALVLAHTTGVTYTQQVTAGTTYRFYNVPMAPTLCRNQGCFSLNPADCPPALGAQERRCNFQVLSQPWQNPQYRLTKATC